MGVAGRGRAIDRLSCYKVGYNYIKTRTESVMWVTTGAGPSVYKRLLFLLLHVFVLSCCSGQQCPRQGLTTFSGNGSVTFTPLPPGSDNINPTYDPGPVGGWFNLARGFVDAARPGGLPYSKYKYAL